MDLNWRSAELAEGLKCYRQEEFFEAHEHWESAWLALHEPEKSFLQAVIQITAAMHHLRKGNRAGAASLLRRSLNRLSKCPSVFGRIHVAQLREEISSCLNEISNGSAAIIKPPNICPIVVQPE